MSRKQALIVLILVAAVIAGAQTAVNGGWLSRFGDFVELADGGTPASGGVRLWANTSGQLVATDDGGADTVLGAGGGGCVFDTRLVRMAASNDGIGPGGLWGTESVEGMHGEGLHGVVWANELNTTDAPAVGDILPGCYTTDSDLTIYLYLRAHSTTTGNAIWDITYNCIGDNEGISASLTDTGANITSDWSSYASGDLIIESQTFTPSGCAAGEFVLIQAAYDINDASDDPSMLGMRITN